MSVERVGYGAGERDDPATPNVLRVLIGREADVHASAADQTHVGHPITQTDVGHPITQTDVGHPITQTDVGLTQTDVGRPFRGASEAERVSVIECEIDDMNPQIFGIVMDRLYAAGALEVFYIAVQMKKNRPGTLLTVVARPEARARMADVIFRETTTIGLRHFDVDRECLPREMVTVETPLAAEARS
jgi:uncharacterized protein (DUF111 family)